MDRLLSESSMRDHPLTPMRDPDLVRVLGRQTQSKIGLVPFVAVDAGVEQTCAAIKKLQAESVRMAVLDAVLDRHIDSAAIACREMRLVTGGAALGGALGAIGHASGAGLIAANRPAEGAIAFLSGSCSTMTRAQVAALVAHVPSFMIDPLALAADAGMVGDIIDWAIEQAKRGDFLVYSTVDPTGLEAIQEQLGRGPAAASLENAFGRIARALAEAGTRKFVVAGGETSGAVTQALGVQMMTFGEELAPGVPRAFTLEPEGFLLVLKSGNFGETDFFLRARGAL
ncbi:MAG TPA: nucleotide-binding domain containing protein, partial [Sphingomonas sp.]|nr:nucleotide-binding domain containing protein [Sphingomonas sp.]